MRFGCPPPGAFSSRPLPLLRESTTFLYFLGTWKFDSLADRKDSPLFDTKSSFQHRHLLARFRFLFQRPLVFPNSFLRSDRRATAPAFSLCQKEVAPAKAECSAQQKMCKPSRMSSSVFSLRFSISFDQRTDPTTTVSPEKLSRFPEFSCRFRILPHGQMTGIRIP